MRNSKAITAALIAVAAIQGCREPHAAIAVTVMPDLTDTMASRPDTSSILRCYDMLKHDRYQGAEFRCVPITDVEHNRAVEASIIPESELLSNPSERTAKVNSFRGEIKSAIMGLDNMPIGRPSSRVIENIANEARRLAVYSAERKILVAYSDLLENGVVNLHSKEGVARLMTYREGVVEQLDREVPNAYLNGVEIHLVYEARDYADSESFSAMAEIYREIFEGRGAKVFVEANFNP